MQGHIAKSLVLLLFALSPIAPSFGSPSGAPADACDNLLPEHGVPPQSTPSPYMILLDRTIINVGTSLTIRLKSTHITEEFKGFLIQVRRDPIEPNSGKPFAGGAFSTSIDNKDAQSLTCSGMPSVAMTHTGPQLKSEVTVRWVPESPGQYSVRATIVKDGSIFWVNQTHDQIIQVLDHGSPDHQYDDSLCSMNPSVPSVQDVRQPFSLKMGPVSLNENQSDDPNKIYQKEMTWINVTSEFDVDIQELFVQVRTLASEKPISVGKFWVAPHQSHITGHMEQVNCFGGVANGNIFVSHHEVRRKEQWHVSFVWEAPEDQDGDFQVFVAILKSGESAWRKIGELQKAGKIKVIEKHSKSLAKTLLVPDISTDAESSQIDKVILIWVLFLLLAPHLFMFIFAGFARGTKYLINRK